MNPAKTSPQQAAWHYFPHGVDIGIQGLGPSLAAAFEQAVVSATQAAGLARRVVKLRPLIGIKG